MSLRSIPRAYRDAFSGLPRNVWLLGFANLVNRSGSMVLPFLSLYFTRHLGFSAVEAGRTLSLYGVGSIVGAYLGGRLSDTLGPVRVQRLSLLGTGVGFLVLSQLRDRLSVSIAVFLLSAIADSFRPAMMTAVAESCRPEILPRSLSLVRLMSNLGFVVGPAVGGFLATRHYGLLFVCDAVTCWAAVAVLGLMPKDAARSGAVPLALAEQAGRSPWRDGPFLAFMGLTVILGTVFFQIFSTLPLYLREAYGLKENVIGSLIALNGLGIACFEMVIVRALEPFDRLRTAAIGGFLVCLGFGLLPLGSTAAFAAVTILVWTAGEMMSLPMTNAAAVQRAPASRSGAYMGAYTVAFSLALVIAPAAGMGVYARFGGAVLWCGIAALGVPLGLGFFVLAPRFRVARPERQELSR